MQLSIVTTLFQSARYIDEFYTRIVSEAQNLVDDFEIILVNDGSKDNSMEVAMTLAKQDSRIKLIELSRNFGHHKALMTGMMHSQGEQVFIIDCDLEEPPELLSLFWQKKKAATKADVVYGVQRKRKGSWWEREGGKLFFKAMNALSGVQLQENAVVARLMSRQFVEALTAHKESELMLGGLFVLTGFVQLPIEVEKGHKGETTYSLAKRISQAVDAITSFSALPLHFFFWFGMLTAIGSAFYAVYLVSMYFLSGAVLSGWTSIMVSLWFFSGCILMAIGTVGIYLSKIYIEVKSRPYTTIKNIWRSETDCQTDVLLARKD